MLEALTRSRVALYSFLWDERCPIENLQRGNIVRDKVKFTRLRLRLENVVVEERVDRVDRLQVHADVRE